MTLHAIKLKPMRYIGVAVAVVLAVLLPRLAPNQFYVHLATIGCINLMLVLGLAIIARAGQLSMGQWWFCTGRRIHLGTVVDKWLARAAKYIHGGRGRGRDRCCPWMDYSAPARRVFRAGCFRVQPDCGAARP